MHMARHEHAACMAQPKRKGSSCRGCRWKQWSASPKKYAERLLPRRMICQEIPGGLRRARRGLGLAKKQHDSCAYPGTVTQKYRNMKRRTPGVFPSRHLFPHGCVARRCHRPCYVASSRLALRKNPSVSPQGYFLRGAFCSAISESQYKLAGSGRGCGHNG